MICFMFPIKYLEQWNLCFVVSRIEDNILFRSGFSYDCIRITYGFFGFPSFTNIKYDLRSIIFQLLLLLNDFSFVVVLKVLSKIM